VLVVESTTGMQQPPKYSQNFMLQQVCSSHLYIQNILCHNGYAAATNIFKIFYVTTGMQQPPKYSQNFMSQ
jgi:hypothetical protein